MVLCNYGDVVNATVTVDHAASSYGRPVVVLTETQEPLDVVSWIAFNYQVLEATQREWEMLQRALSPWATPRLAPGGKIT